MERGVRGRCVHSPRRSLVGGSSLGVHHDGDGGIPIPRVECVARNATKNYVLATSPKIRDDIRHLDDLA